MEDLDIDWKDLFQQMKEEEGKEVILLQYLVDNQMTNQKEELLKLLIRMIKRNHPDQDESKHMVLEILKANLNEGAGLVDCINFVHQMFPWTNIKRHLMNFVQLVINIIFGWGLYCLDIGTDIYFIYDVFYMSQYDFSESSSHCEGIDII